MFNDERINNELGKVKKYLAMFVLVFTLINIILKIIYVMLAGGLIFTNYLLDGVIVISSVLYLILVVTAHSSNVKDELYQQETTKYYNNYFKYFVGVVAITYAIIAPFIIRQGLVIWTGNRLITFLLLFGILFAFSYLRSKHTYLNYNVIEENSNVYYKKIFINILKLGIVFAIMLGISIVFSIFTLAFGYTNCFAIMLACFIAYVISYISIALFYLIFSAFEKSIYSQEGIAGLSIPTIILLVSSIVISICLKPIEIIDWEKVYYNLYVTNVNASGTLTLGEFVTIVMSFSSYLEMIYLILLTCGIVFLYYDLKTSINKEDAKKIIKVAFIVCIIFKIINIYRTILSPEINSIIAAIDDPVVIYSLATRFNSIMAIFNQLLNCSLLVSMLIVAKKCNRLFNPVLIVLIYSIIELLINALIRIGLFGAQINKMIYTVYLIISFQISICVIIVIILKHKKNKNVFIEV